MTVLFIFLVFGLGTSLFFHEVAGIVIYVLYAFHLSLNFRWIKRVLKNLIQNKIGRNDLIKLILGITLFAGMITILITGVLISRILFNLNLVSDLTLSTQIHNYASYISLGVLAIHVAMHIKYLVVLTGKIINNLNAKSIRRTIITTAALCAVAAIVYGQAYNAYNGVISTTNVTLSNKETKTEAVTQQSSATTTTQSTTSETTTQTTKKKEETTTKGTTTTEAVVKTLNEYLGNLHCTGCGRHCSLLSPQCNTGRSQATVATQDYYDKYQVS